MQNKRTKQSRWKVLMATVVPVHLHRKEMRATHFNMVCVLIMNSYAFRRLDMAKT